MVGYWHTQRSADAHINSFGPPATVPSLFSLLLDWQLIAAQIEKNQGLHHLCIGYGLKARAVPLSRAHCRVIYSNSELLLQ